MDYEIIRMKDEDASELIRSDKLCYRISMTQPYTREYDYLVSELFKGNIGSGSTVHAPFHCTEGSKVKIGRDTIIMYNVDMMSSGGIIIGDNVMIAAGTKIVTNNHDYTDHRTLLTKPVVLKDNCWLGASCVILPGVTVGENSVVAAGAVVTSDVPPDTVVGGVPAKEIKKTHE